MARVRKGDLKRARRSDTAPVALLPAQWKYSQQGPDTSKRTRSECLVSLHGPSSHLVAQREWFLPKVLSDPDG